MLSRTQIKDLKQLHLKKYRDRENVFVAEGQKIAVEILQSDLKILSFYATSDFVASNRELIHNSQIKIHVISRAELTSISHLSEPDDCFIVAEKKSPQVNFSLFENELILYLDGIRDPGNLGTMIRICDWFGIRNLICSIDCVDTYNPKVIQATMGSFLRVTPSYLDFPILMNEINNRSIQLPLIYGSYMEGENLLQMDKFEPGILIIGSESHGIRSELLPFVDRKITIPRFSDRAESLNAAIAASICISQFRRLNS
jgi:RNA methyltransferase, TrmH family